MLSEWVAADSELGTVIHPWPQGARFAFVLTHDVETREGFERIAGIAEIEEKLGFRSSWNIVPHKYRIDIGLLRELESRGFEIGIHGFNHDGRLYASKETFARRAVHINAALDRYAAVGFRSPMVHRNLEWLQRLDIEYDASCFDVDPYQPAPGGVGSIWPFIAGKFVELPYTLPQDHTLFVTLGQRDAGIWHRKLEFIVENNGMALMLTHPDYLSQSVYVDAYREFLSAVRGQAGGWHALPREVGQWWRARHDSRLSRIAGGPWVVEGPAAQTGRVATILHRNDGISLEHSAASRNRQRVDPDGGVRGHRFLSIVEDI
jgi:peptidoglycan/xylan/chitin deacetylase (PgdA/CDA1 family)